MKRRNIIRSTTELALHIAGSYITSDSIAVDATCGNGHDTLALAKLSPAMLYAFDIQQSAIEATHARLEAEGFSQQLADGSIRLIMDSHENMAAHISRPVDAVMFNLGYLPGADKHITTSAPSTISAVKTALAMLNRNGLICITMYSGHSSGAEEKAELLAFASKLDPHDFHVSYISMTNQPNNPPEILLITRK